MFESKVVQHPVRPGEFVIEILCTANGKALDPFMHNLVVQSQAADFFLFRDPLGRPGRRIFSEFPACNCAVSTKGVKEWKVILIPLVFPQCSAVRRLLSAKDSSLRIPMTADSKYHE